MGVQLVVAAYETGLVVAGHRLQRHGARKRSASASRFSYSPLWPGVRRAAIPSPRTPPKASRRSTGLEPLIGGRPNHGAATNAGRAADGDGRPWGAGHGSPGAPSGRGSAASSKADTVELSGLSSSRLIGVDTPEVYGGVESGSTTDVPSTGCSCVRAMPPRWRSRPTWSTPICSCTWAARRARRSVAVVVGGVRRRGGSTGRVGPRGARFRAERPGDGGGRWWRRPRLRGPPHSAPGAGLLRAQGEPQRDPDRLDGDGDGVVSESLARDRAPVVNGDFVTRVEHSLTSGPGGRFGAASRRLS